MTASQRRYLIVHHLLPAYRARPREVDFDTWRREFLARWCGRRGLRACSNHEWDTIVAACWAERGRDDLAMSCLLREQPQAKRQALYLTLRLCDRVGLSRAYPEALARRIFGAPLDALSAHQAWCIYYTLKQRCRARQRKAVVKAEIKQAYASQ